MTEQLPQYALSVRQPWAWAIIHAGKDVENRDWRRPNPGLKFRGRVCIHASRGITQTEYLMARKAIEDLPVLTADVPEARDLVRGAIIGTVDVVGIVRKSDRDGGPWGNSPWFFGPMGLALADPRPCEPVLAQGQLGFFTWANGPNVTAPDMPRWMAPKPEIEAPVQKGLFGDYG